MPPKKKIHFEISERKILLRFFDVLFVITALYCVGTLFKFDYFEISKTNFYWILVLGLYINVLGTVFEIYNLQTASNQFKIIKNVIITASVTVLFFLLTPVFTPPLPNNRLQILYFFIAVVSALLAWRIFYQKYIASYRFAKNVVFLCEATELDTLVFGLKSIDPHYKIIGFINSKEKENDLLPTSIEPIEIENLRTFIDENSISELVVGIQKTKNITIPIFDKLQELRQEGFVIREYSEVYEEITQRISVQNFDKDFFNYFPFSRSNQNKLYLFSVRLVEVVAATMGLSFGVLLLPCIGLGNLIGNKGSLFYSQLRVGKNGKTFKILKFRTMIENAEKEGISYAISNDARITSFGNFLRRTRIDEIPQFINILRGEMALIGPRPERPYFVDSLSQTMPFYKIRHIVKPGVTGWAQVNYSYGSNEEDSLIKLQYDLYYIKHRTIFLDINIVLKTVGTILFYRGQ
jgi:exopolysaccharide biosynthesis polyprenyl glycosylphosphotransferase